MRNTLKRDARRALDQRLADVNFAMLATPTGGWVRAVRDALGLTARQLGNRLGIAASSVSELEASERAGTAQLATLRRAADAMECDLVYAFVPRTSLDDAVRARATKVARREIARIDTTMKLEGQSLSRERLEARVSDFAEGLIDDRSLWDERT